MVSRRQTRVYDNARSDLVASNNAKRLSARQGSALRSSSYVGYLMSSLDNPMFLAS
jgi:hypothetical protein